MLAPVPSLGKQPRRDEMARISIRRILDSSGDAVCAGSGRHGQLASGSILGIVRDSTGAVMQAVIVSAKNVDSGAVRTATTDNTVATRS